MLKIMWCIISLPLLEVTIEDSAGETFPADPDAL